VLVAGATGGVGQLVTAKLLDVSCKGTSGKGHAAASVMPINYAHATLQMCSVDTR
jgi:hypothetical protein